MPTSVRAFVQARMSSRRFPGKVLAPFRGRPLIHSVLAAVGQALPDIPVVVVTSQDQSDDPLAGYLLSCGVAVFRGSLDNVFERFRCCVAEHRCKWILRLNGDSPLLDARILQAVVGHAAHTEHDLVTTIFPRTFPKGNNAELIRVRRFVEIDPRELTPGDREHVTSVYYRNPSVFRILNVESGSLQLADLSLAVDTVEDLHRLEQMTEADLRRFAFASLTSAVR